MRSHSYTKQIPVDSQRDKVGGPKGCICKEGTLKNSEQGSLFTVVTQFLHTGSRCPHNLGIITLNSARASTTACRPACPAFHRRFCRLIHGPSCHFDRWQTTPQSSADWTEGFDRHLGSGRGGVN